MSDSPRWTNADWFRRFLARLSPRGLARLARRLGTASALAAAAFLADPSNVVADEPLGAGAPRPNIIMIMADDLGYGDVGFTGQQILQTPSIDALAQGGTVTTRDGQQISVGGGRVYSGMYCPAGICTPTRSALMTGMHTGHVVADRNTGLGYDYPLNPDDVTVANVLSSAGYDTGLVGKWGLGPGTKYDTPTLIAENMHSAPTNKGFDTFYGYLNQVRAHDYEVPSLWETDAGAPDGLSLTPTNGVYTHDLVADYAETYIQQRAGSADPFYLQVNFTPPHFDIDAVPQQYRDPYEGLGWSDKKVKSAAMIAHLDATVGDVLARVYDPDGDGDLSDSISDNTLVIFCSDNGPAEEDGSDPDFFDSAGPFKGKKRDLYDGGIRTAFAVRWDGVIAPGTDSTYVGGLEDFLPTAAELAGVDAPIGVDGISMAASLLGSGEQTQRDWLVWEFHETSSNITGPTPARWAIRKDDWKLIKFADGHYELYDLANDVGETTNLVDANPALKAEMEAIALAEGVEQPEGWAAEYRSWQGQAGEGSWLDASNWSGSDAPAGNWVATLDAADTDRSALVSADSEVLGMQLGASTGQMTVQVEPGRTLAARNGVRVYDAGRINLRGGGLATHRQIDIRQGGRLEGSGQLAGQMVNAGTLSPGQAVPSGGGDSIDTGTVHALQFDFSGVQDDAPLSAPSTLSEYLVLSAGLDFGPGTQSKESASGTDLTNAGDEFNVVGFESNSLAGAIASSDYLTYSVAPAAGLQMKLDEVHFTLWRNGSNAAPDYALLASHLGFTDSDAITQLNVPGTGLTQQVTLSGSPASDVWTTGPIEIRLYGWSGQLGGNTHVNAAGMDASFQSIDGQTFGPNGVLTLAGDFRQTQEGAMAMGLAGTDNSDGDDAGYDQLIITGEASLAGTLELSLADGYAPALGTQFTIIQAGTLSGTFDAVTGVTRGPESLAVTYDESCGLVTVTIALTGDANLDGRVDLRDASALLTSWDSAGRTWSQGDFDGDGTVGPADAQLIVDNWGAGLASGQGGAPQSLASKIPEPTSLIVLSLGLLAGIGRTQRDVSR